MRKKLILCGVIIVLAIACIIVLNIDRLTSVQDGITEEKAIEIAKDTAEYYTLNGMIDGSKTARKVTFNEITEVKKTYWRRRWYYDISIDAEVEFSDRGRVHKTYDVRIDANTGDAADDVGVVWSLE